jgi:hypothetical protein
MDLLGFGRAMLERWVKAQNLEVTSCECCWFFKGPFFWSTKGQEVFRFSVRDKDGVVKSGYARCGGYWFGTLSDQVEVRWDP